MIEGKIRFLLLSGVMYCVSWPLTLFALPSGEQPVHGEVHFERHEGQLKIHASDGSIVNYKNFDVARHESIEFIQPNASARILNRIQGSSPSQIDGKLRANGRVYLMNPAGIIFGPHAIVQVGGLFAAAAHVKDEDFLLKRDHIFNVKGDVINQGMLKADAIHLIGNKVDNQGVIDAPHGLVTLLSGHTVMIGEENGHCFVAVDREASPLGGITATDLIGLAINHTGKITAKEVHVEGGDQSTLHVSGAIDVHGEQGGTVRILGDAITLQTLDIDATGQIAGGTVLVGGDYQGGGDLRKAQLTWADEDVHIDASALRYGNGGKVILWSEGSTLFDGYIRSRGGLEGGDGGLIETSGKMGLGCLQGRVDTLAPLGRAGEWLLDPLTITIAAAGAGTLIQAANCADVATNLTIANGTINAAAANVTLCASSTITQQLGAPINIATAGVTLTFQSSGVTTLNDNITTNNAAINFTSSPQTNVVLGGDVAIASGGGAITFGGSITGASQTLSLNSSGSGAIDIQGAVTLGTLSMPTAGAYQIALEGGGTITTATTFNATGGGAGVAFGNSTLPTLTFTGGVTTPALTTTNVTGTVQTVGTSTMTLGSVAVQASGATLQVGTGALTAGDITLTGPLSLVSSGGPITTVAVLSSPVLTFPLTINVSPISTGVVQINGACNVSTINHTNSYSTLFGNTVTATTVNLTNAATFVEFGGSVAITTLNTSVQPYQVIFETGGTVTTATTFVNTGGVQFGNTSLASITFTGGVNTNQTSVTTSTFGVVSTTGTSMTLGPVILLGNTTMNTSSGALTFNSTLTGAHNLTVNTGTTAPVFTGAVSIGDVVGNTSLIINTTGTNTVFSSTLTTVGGVTSNNNLVFNNNVSVGGAISIPSLTTNVVPTSAYNVAFLGGGTITALTNFYNVGTVTFGSATLPTLNFTNGVSTVSGPTMTYVQGTVNVTVASAPLSFGATTFSAGNSTLTTNNGVMILGNVTLTGNATLQTQGANLTMGNVSGAGNLTTNTGTTGTTTIASLNCNTFTPSNSLSVTITGTTTAATVNLGAMAAGQSVVFNGLVNISTALITAPVAYSVTFNAGGTVTPFTNFFNTGGLNLGNSTSSSITFTNGVNTFFPGVVTNTAGVIRTVSGNMTLGVLNLVDRTMLQTTGNNITFNGVVNGNYQLYVSAPGGIVTFNAVVGGTTPVSVLDVLASSIVINANMTAQGGTLIYNGPVTLGVDTILTDTGNTGIFFLSTINGAFKLTLNAHADVSVTGVVGGTTPLERLTVTAGGSTTFSSNVSTSGGAGLDAGNITVTSGGAVTCSGTLFARGGTAVGNGFNGGNVTITSSGSSVTVTSIDVSGSDGVGFFGGNSGNITLQPASGYSQTGLGNLPQGTLGIYGTLTALGGGGSSSGTSGNISLSAAGRSTTMSVATIFGNPAGSDLTIQGANLTIGQNEAMTVLGNALFNIGQTATVGDIVALNNLTINAGTLQLLRHEPGQILNFQGILYTNHRVHLISRGTQVNASIVDVGSGPSSAILTLNGLSSSFFRTLLFYGSTVLNFDGEVPVSGIIDYVLPADTTWDTVPLPSEQISWKQILAERINRTARCMPDLKELWAWVEGASEDLHPMDIAIADYIMTKGHEQQIFSLDDFAYFLGTYQGNDRARQYLAKVRYLLDKVRNEPKLGLASSFREKIQRFLLLKKEEKAQTCSRISPSAAYYFQEDVTEFTRPNGLTQDQWVELLGFQ